MTTLAHYLSGGSIRYYPDKPMGEGTEKEFFRTEDENLIVGFFKDRKDDDDAKKIERLTHIVEKFNPLLDPKQGEFWSGHFCWPKAVVTKPRIGIVCPRFPKQYYFKDAKGEKKGRWFLTRLVNRMPESERGDLPHRLQVCRHLVRAVGRMHMAGLAHSDLSGNNVLMDPPKGTCMIIDIDSLVVPNMFPPKVLGTRGYIAPEVVETSGMPLKHPKKNLPNIKTDLHSLAVIIYELMLLRHPLEGKKVHSADPETDDLLNFGKNALFVENPHDDSNRPEGMAIPYEHLGPFLVPLFDRAFVDGLHEPEVRPTTFEWEDALVRTMDILYPCGGEKCWHQWFAFRRGIDPECPFCGWKPPEPVPAMRLFRKYRTGQFASDRRYIAIWDGRKIHAWHSRSDAAFPDALPDNNACTGAFSTRDGRWLLTNESGESMVCPEIGRIHKGEFMEISDKQIVQLYPLPKGRVAAFEFFTRTKE